MKRICSMLIFIAAMTIAAAAQTEKIEQSKAWKTFQTAIAENDRRRVASMIAFPFEASIIGEELNFKIEIEADFLKNYGAIFNAARRKKIARGKIVSVASEDGFNFEMYENGAHHVFTFRKIGNVYELVGTIAAG